MKEYERLQMLEVPKLPTCLDLGCFWSPVKTGKWGEGAESPVNIVFFAIIRDFTNKHFTVPNMIRG